MRTPLRIHVATLRLLRRVFFVFCRLGLSFCTIGVLGSSPVRRTINSETGFTCDDATPSMKIRGEQRFHKQGAKIPVQITYAKSGSQDRHKRNRMIASTDTSTVMLTHTSRSGIGVSTLWRAENAANAVYPASTVSEACVHRSSPIRHRCHLGGKWVNHHPESTRHAH